MPSPGPGPGWAAAPAPAASPLLEVSDLAVSFATERGVARAVDGVSFTIGRGDTVGLVGESGCGKTVTALSLLKLVEPPGRVMPGSRVRFAGRDLLPLSEGALREVRGREMAMIFQEPAASLNPVFTIGEQIAETLRAHGRADRRGARSRAVELLRLVGMPEPELRAAEYPHQLSGGMCQRAMIAMALSCEPKLIIADEPTTQLDVTVQAQILALLTDLQRRLGLALLLITHDLGVVAGATSRVLVMYAGQIVEEAPTAALFKRPSHPYSEALLAAVPRLNEPAERLRTIAGQMPLATDWPAGCRFHPRCPHAWERCRAEAPPLLELAPDHRARCWLVEEPERRAAPR